uniref:Uncharacterized protein orf166 n=1 Tax=Cyanophora paradoxa TaxID=2762 RepID=E9P1C2_CYAPA|nr:hypothetical protein CYPAM_p03 [Cyanophora paradoxa]ADW79174.1 hypothetical protein [Cyanophora paradoxa]
MIWLIKKTAKFTLKVLFYLAIALTYPRVKEILTPLPKEKQRFYLSFVHLDLEIWLKRINCLSDKEVNEIRREIRREFAGILGEHFFWYLDLNNVNYWLEMDFSNLILLKTAIGFFQWFILTKDNYNKMEDFFFINICSTSKWLCRVGYFRYFKKSHQTSSYSLIPK